MSTFLELVARLSAPESRRSAARTLARAIGADDLMILVPDPEIDVLLPALGFPQTLPRGNDWPAFVAAVAQNGSGDSHLPSPYTGEEVRALGERFEGRAVLVLLGGNVDPAASAELSAVMPLVTSMFALERRAARAGQIAERAGEAAEQARVLATGLYAAQRDLERALDETSRAKDRFAFLSEVGTLLSASLNLESTLAGVARLMTSRQADVCVIDLSDETDSVSPIASHASGAEDGEPRAILTRLLRDPERPDFVRELMRKQSTWSADQYAGAASAIIVPLIARRGGLGAMTIATAAGRRYEADDVSLAEEVARRIGLATSNALLYMAAQSAIRAREEFLSIASHEFRTPVAAIKLSLQSIERNIKSKKPSAEAQNTRINTALQQIDRLDKLTNKLLDVTRIATGQLRLDLEKVDLVDVVCDVADRLADHFDRAGCEMKLDGAARVVGVWDRIRVEQIVVNLLTNALRYGAGKPIELLVEDLRQQARLTVRDHGAGITREVQAHIFKRFERATSSRSSDGLGLGLYITRQIVEAHGGAIRVASVPGEGAAFIVELPIAPAAP